MKTPMFNTLILLLQVGSLKQNIKHQNFIPIGQF